jgi:hypothetical protein
MFDVFAAYATDDKKENEGVEIPLGGGASMTVARMPNEKYSKILVERHEANQEMMRGLPKEQADKLDRDTFITILADTVLLDFKGISFKGKALKYTRDNAIKLLQIKDFRVKVITEAQNLDNFRVKLDGDDAGN